MMDLLFVLNVSNSFMEKPYFYRLYQYNTKLFFIIVGFSGMTLFFNLTGDQVMPFFVWAMFSEIESPKKNYKTYQLTINRKPYDYSARRLQPSIEIIRESLQHYDITTDLGEDPTRHFFQHKLPSYYDNLSPILNRITPSSEQIITYPSWLKRYLSYKLQHPINTLEVKTLELKYVDKARVKLIHSKPLLYD